MRIRYAIMGNGGNVEITGFRVTAVLGAALLLATGCGMTSGAEAEEGSSPTGAKYAGGDATSAAADSAAAEGPAGRCERDAGDR